jgi:hypothetical protein
MAVLNIQLRVEDDGKQKVVGALVTRYPGQRGERVGRVGRGHTVAIAGQRAIRNLLEDAEVKQLIRGGGNAD